MNNFLIWECKEIDVNLQDKYEETALTKAWIHEHLDVANRLLEFQKTKIREGFRLSNDHVPSDLIELITEFTFEK